MFLLVGAIAKNRGLEQELVLVRKKKLKINKQGGLFRTREYLMGHAKNMSLA